MRLVEHRREPTDEAQGHGGKAGRAGYLDGNAADREQNGGPDRCVGLPTKCLFGHGLSTRQRPQPPTRPETVTSIAGERVGASRIG